MAAAAKKKPAAKKAPAKKAAAKRPAAKKAANKAAGSVPLRKALEDLGVAGADYPPLVTRRVLLGPSGEPTEVHRAASDYFASVNKEGVEFVSSGCALIDAVLGGGWALGRMANVVGDKSAGKTLLAIEACANFARQYPDGYIRYAETEAAFDVMYAEALGLPVDRVDFEAGDPEKGITTVEDFHEDVERVLDANPDRPILYILDSFDALSDRAEAERSITDNSFGASKAKKSGELFRRLTQRIESQRCLLMIVSQLRDKIGVTFGEKQTRSGGRALDFYASQIVWLAEIGKIAVERGGVKRPIGVNVRMKCKKNKVGLPFRECEYPVIFGYGVDDLTAGVEWLIEVKRQERLSDLGMSPAGYKVRIENLRNKGGAVMREARATMDAIVREEWQEIEKRFLPKSGKY
ncbi:recombinase A [compost metagenome]